MNRRSAVVALGVFSSFFSCDVQSRNFLGMIDGMERYSASGWTKVHSLKGVHVGPPGDPRMRIFFDPNCPWCAKLFMVYLKYPQLKLCSTYWIPISYLVKESTGRAAAILRKGNEAAMLENFRVFTYPHGGSITPVEPTPEESSIIAKNNAAWDTPDFRGSPYTIFQDQAGQTWKFGGYAKKELLYPIFEEATISREVIREYK